VREHEGIRKKKEGRTRALEEEEDVGEERDKKERRENFLFGKKNRLQKISFKGRPAWKECEGCVWSGHDCPSIARQRNVEKKG
jgi:hypothetical protein